MWKVQVSHSQGKDLGRVGLDKGEMPSFLLAPHHLQQAEDLALGAGELVLCFISCCA